MATAETATTQSIEAGNGIRFAYRRFGKTSEIPTVFHMHLRGSMDFWDPLLINTIAEKRTVILFDSSGVQRSNGNVPTTCRGWAENVVAFVEALGYSKIDLFGFSMGGFAAQMVALITPHLVRKLVLAGTAPSQPSAQVPGIVWPLEQSSKSAFETFVQADTREEGESATAAALFPDTEQGRIAAKAYFSRIYTRNGETTAGESPIFTLLPPEATTRQLVALGDWNTPNPQNSFDRLKELKMPVLVQNGDTDTLVPSSRSWEFVKGIHNAQLIIYPRAGHGFLWQYAKRVGEDVNTFLDNEL